MFDCVWILNTVCDGEENKDAAACLTSHQLLLWLKSGIFGGSLHPNFVNKVLEGCCKRISPNWGQLIGAGPS